MLRWRLPLGILIVGVLVALFWLDHLAKVPGAWLLPVAILLTVAVSREVLQLVGQGGMDPLGWAVYCGNLLLVAGSWVGPACRFDAGLAPLDSAGTRTLLALAVGVLLVLVGEMRRYETPGRATANIAAAVFVLVYVGLMFSFVVQLRMTWGVLALASLVVVVKMGDTGAYTVGRLLGRRKLAPVLSPGKTIEGAIGSLAFACLGSWATFHLLVPLLEKEETRAIPWWGWIQFGLLVGTAGLLGDLAESLLKRDVGRKDSSTWLPGYGGILDLLDSLLLAAPVACFCWCCWQSGPVAG